MTCDSKINLLVHEPIKCPIAIGPRRTVSVDIWTRNALDILTNSIYVNVLLISIVL
jgi:hypothetical protein